MSSEGNAIPRKHLEASETSLRHHGSGPPMDLRDRVINDELLRHGTRHGSREALRDDNSSVRIIFAKVVDDFLMEGNRADTKAFLRKLEGQFNLGAAERGSDLRFLGCAISIRNNGPPS